MKQTKGQYHYAVRRCKKAAHEINNDKYVEALLKGDIDLFEAVKKGRIKNRECATKVDGHKGAENISNHFRNQYEELYNQQSSRVEMGELLDSINDDMEHSEINEADKITPDLVKEIINSKIKSNKSDVHADFNSDCLKNAPDSLFQMIAKLFRSLAIHGFMPAILLFCAIIPLVKDPSGSLDSSSNYRGIAISSLLLKIWDWIVIILHGSSLSSDELQFGFKKASSTSLCTWSVVETVNYYKRGGSEVFCCLLDCKKAFDTVEHKKIFKKLVDKIPLIFVRILLVTYMGQKCFVRWNSSESSQFSVQNGVRQGAVLSPILFSLYVNDLIELLRASGMGCFVGQQYFGIVAYADDILLLAPRRQVLQKMIQQSEDYMDQHKISFSTTKTKCIYFGPNKEMIKKVVVAGSEMEWSKNAVHLGITISEDASMEQDIKVKRARFIDECHNLQEEFGQSHPEVQAKLLTLYNSSCYGSNTWNLFGEWARKLQVSWNVDLKHIWNLPHETHRYFFEHLTQCRHLKILLIRRFLKFVVAILEGEKSSCRLLLRTILGTTHSTTGNNIRKIGLEAGLRLDTEDIKSKIEEVCEKISFAEMPEDQLWRVASVKELSLIKSKNLQVEGFSSDEIDEMLQYICVS